LQSASPSGQDTLVQVPPLQKPEAQARRHLPQLSGSLRTSVSQASAAFALHSAKP
jgi:hypothetical protein